MHSFLRAVKWDSDRQTDRQRERGREGERERGREGERGKSK